MAENIASKRPAGRVFQHHHVEELLRKLARVKRARAVEIHFYEWRATTWATSETRDRLDAAGRGIYRELLDQCYLQGKFPDDVEWICRKCACSQQEYEKAWPKIERHFPISTPGYRNNMPANIVRRSNTSNSLTNRGSSVNMAKSPSG